MRSVRLFLPSRIIAFMNFVTDRSWYFGSGSTSLRLTSPLRGMAMAHCGSGGTATYRPDDAAGSLRSFGSVLRAALTPILHADRVEGAADDVVAHAGQALHPASPDEHDRVLLEVVTHPGDVRRHLDAVGQPDSGNLAQR